MISHHIRDNICIVSLTGRITLAETPEIELYLATLLKMDFDGFIINFAQADYIDSSGIGLLILFSRKLITRQTPLAFCHVATILTEITFATSAVKISVCDTEEEAFIGLQKHTNYRSFMTTS